MSFYAVLGIPVSADEETIRAAYRILARRYHPDRGTGSSSEEFRRVAEAYETLIDPGRRRAYDLSLPPARLQPGVTAEPVAAPSFLRRENPEVFGRPVRRF